MPTEKITKDSFTLENAMQQTAQPEMLQAGGDFAKFTPKYCTVIQVGVLSNSNIILSMIYAEGGQPASIIERVVIDVEHANRLSQVLKDAVEKINGEDLV